MLAILIFVMIGNLGNRLFEILIFIVDDTDEIMIDRTTIIMAIRMPMELKPMMRLQFVLLLLDQLQLESTILIAILTIGKPIRRLQLMKIPQLHLDQLQLGIMDMMVLF